AALERDAVLAHAGLVLLERRPLRRGQLRPLARRPARAETGGREARAGLERGLHLRRAHRLARPPEGDAVALQACLVGGEARLRRRAERDGRESRGGGHDQGGEYDASAHWCPFLVSSS